MDGTEEREDGADAAGTGGGGGETAKGRASRGPGREGGRSGGDEPRRRRAERRRPGFDDGIERAYCLLRGHVPPPDFPVQHRLGVATLRTVVVGRRPDALLLCDAEHDGPHRWPDGEPASAADESVE
jgi:hypothetical protein